MCGIAGIVGSSDQDLMGRMLDEIAHRGPDDAGVIHLQSQGDIPSVVLGHRRLSVIDLSQNGHQPMSNDDGSRWIVFNGEVYNFAGLRNKLIKAGHQFRSSSDTEVILRGHEVWGDDAVHELNGMFAYALFDRRKGDLRPRK